MDTKEITKELASLLMPHRPLDANKGTFGKVLNIAGCLNYQGAAYLSSVAPLKIGAGLVTLATIEKVVNNLAGNCPWITFIPLKDHQGKCIAGYAFSEITEIIDDYDVVSIGPGLSTMPAVSEFCEDVIKLLYQKNKKAVIDADALNILSKTDITNLPSDSVITPHPKELSRLTGLCVEEIQSDRIKAARFTSEKYGCCVILKGNKTVICTREQEVFINTSGNSSLSKAGSGDVLTGIISGLLAQGCSVKEASILGVYMHGLCGEMASEKLTVYSVLATDQINEIPNAIKKISEK